jgi:hypothetical protein
MKTENLINDDLSSDINNYIDSIIDNYGNLGKKPCVSILKYEKRTNNIYIMLMYSANEFQECINLKKHIKGCKCRNILYISMILDDDYNLIQINDNSLYIYDLYNIILGVIKMYNL